MNRSVLRLRLLLGAIGGLLRTAKANLSPLAAAFFLTAGIMSFAPLSAVAQDTPSTEQAPPRAAWPSARQPTPSQQPQATPQEEPGWRMWLLGMQRKLQTQLAASVRGLKTENALLAAFTLVGLSFLYGVFHAAGPGHGKAVISSYVVANRTTMRRGIILSFLSSLVQALSAIGIVAVLTIGANAAGVQIRQAVHQLEIVSAVLVILAGLWLLYVQAQRHLSIFHPVGAVAGGHGVTMPTPDSHDHGHTGHHHAHDHGESCGCGHAHMPLPKDIEGRWSLRQAAAIVLAVGIRPCTGAILVLIFALTQGMFWAGVAATFAMALGTAITVSALAALAVGSRETAVRFAGSRWTDRVYAAAGVAGALFVLFFGGLLLYGAMQPQTPF